MKSKEAMLRASPLNTPRSTPIATAMEAPNFCKAAQKIATLCLEKLRKAWIIIPPNRNMNIPTIAKKCRAASPRSAPTMRSTNSGKNNCTSPLTQVAAEIRKMIQRSGPTLPCSGTPGPRLRQNTTSWPTTGLSTGLPSIYSKISNDLKCSATGPGP